MIPYLDLSQEDIPLYDRVCRGLRDAIQRGRLHPGARLPSTRALAEDLQLARMTVMRAYRQLEAEGYVESNTGAGTWVCHELPDQALRARPSNGWDHAGPPGGAVESDLSWRGRRLVEIAKGVLPDQDAVPFLPGVPALDRFPRRLWRATERAAGRGPAALRQADPMGEPTLRRAIAEFVAATRGGTYHPDQVVVTAGSQETLSVLAELLLDREDVALCEDPGYRAARTVFEQMCEVVSRPVDREGMVVGDPSALPRNARLAYMTPSHQFPLGHAMSLDRRRAWLEWAAGCGGWIVEDDYDGEYRFEGRPEPSLRSLDRAGCVVYVNSFNKMLFPALRVGFAILPDRLVEPFRVLQRVRLRPAGVLPQRTVARFIEEGHLARHLREMRTVYRERQEALTSALLRELGGEVEISALDAGNHAVLWLPPGLDAEEVARRAATGGIVSIPLQVFTASVPAPRQALVLGYGGYPPETLGRAGEALARAVA